jgi:hypothetical protein
MFLILISVRGWVSKFKKSPHRISNLATAHLFSMSFSFVSVIPKYFNSKHLEMIYWLLYGMTLGCILVKRQQHNLLYSVFNSKPNCTMLQDFKIKKKRTENESSGQSYTEMLIPYWSFELSTTLQKCHFGPMLKWPECNIWIWHGKICQNEWKLDGYNITYAVNSNSKPELVSKLLQFHNGLILRTILL